MVVSPNAPVGGSYGWLGSSHPRENCRKGGRRSQTAMISLNKESPREAVSPSFLQHQGHHEYSLVVDRGPKARLKLSCIVLGLVEPVGKATYAGAPHRSAAENIPFPMLDGCGLSWL